jgi:hypothetical protein
MEALALSLIESTHHNRLCKYNKSLGLLNSFSECDKLLKS